ncbi:MAG: hypothetical protein ACYC7E_16700 [Armatimonadota bacterium]
MSLAYCPNLAHRIERLRALYERRAQDQIFASMAIPRHAVAEFARQYPAGPCGFPPLEERTRFWDAYWQESIGLLDDQVPSAYLSELDQGLYGGLVGGEVRFMAEPSWGWVSSMVPPILSDWSEFSGLHRQVDGEWERRYRTILDLFTRAAQGRFGISHFILIDSLNFVFELFGATKTYMDLDENPEMIRRAVDFAFELNTWVQDRFFDAVPLVEGGTCSFMCSWIPGRIVTESVDPFHMTSADYLVEWGIEPVERIFARYDGGIVHIHGNGRHLLETVRNIKGLRAIYLGDDVGIPAAFDVLPEIRRRVGDLPLVVSVPFDKFTAALRAHQLVGGVYYVVGSVPNQDEGNRVMDDVRSYRE